VYDIAVEDNENFCAGLGNLFIHNTFTIANIIQELQKPTLVMAPNKTLAAQLYNELKDLFPENAVHYFVSYYDYYQPEAYMPVSGLYIEKDFSVNEEIERLRLAAAHAIRTRKDVIIVATVSCIYGLGNPDLWETPHHYHSQQIQTFLGRSDEVRSEFRPFCHREKHALTNWSKVRWPSNQKEWPYLCRAGFLPAQHLI